MNIAETRFSRKRGAGGPGTARPAAPRPRWDRKAHSRRGAHRAAAMKTGPKAETCQRPKSPPVPNGFPSSKIRPRMAPSPRPDTVLERKIQPFLQLDNVPAGLMAQGAAAISEKVFRGIHPASLGWECSELELDLSRGPRGDEARGGKGSTEGVGAPGPKPRAPPGRPSPDEQRPQGLGPVLPSPQSPCPCTILLTTGPLLPGSDGSKAAASCRSALGCQVLRPRPGPMEYRGGLLSFE